MAFVHLAMIVRSMVGGFFGKTSFLSATFLSGAFLSGHLKQVLDVSVELPLVGLHRQQVVGAAVDDLLGNLGLAAHGVDGDDAPAQLQQRQQLGDGGDFVGMGLGAGLAQHQVILGGPGAHQVQRGPALPPVMASPQGLAVDGHHLSLGQLGHRSHPGHETGAELVGVQPAEHPPKGIVGWNAVGQP